MNQNLENLFKRMIMWGIYTTMFIPLLISPYVFLPDKFAKAVIFRIIVEIISIPYLLLALSKKEYRPHFNPLAISVISFWLVGLFSTFFSTQPFTSVWGSATRGSGFFNFTHYVIFFFIVSGIVKTKMEWKHIFSLAIYAAAIISLFGILQNLFPSLNASFMNSSSERPSGTMGNTIMLSNFLAMLLFTALAFWRAEKTTITKILYFISATLMIITIFITKTRGTWMGLMIGALIFIIIYPFEKITRKKRYMILLTILSIAFILFIFNNNLHIIPDRLLNIGNLNRFTSWNIAIKTIAKKPILGWGPDNFSIPFDKYYPGGYTESYNSLAETWWDKAHNTPLEVGTTMGIFGIIAYLAIFISLFQTLRKSSYGAENTLPSYIIGATIIVYFTQNLTSFDSVISYILFFLFLAYAIFLSQDQKKQKNDYYETANWKWILWATISVITLFLTIKLSVIPFLLNYKTNKNVILAREGRYVEAMEFYRDITQKNQNKTYFEKELNEKFMKIASHFIPALSQDINMTEEYIKINQEVIELLKKSAKFEPMHTKHYYNIGLFYNNIGTAEPYALNNGLEYFEKALELSPNREQTLIESSKTLIALSNFDLAIERLNKTVSLNPQLAETYFWIGIANLYKGEVSIGEKYLSYAEKNGYEMKEINILKMITGIFSDLRLFEKTVPYYIKILELEPKNIDTHALLAGTYKKIGETNKAREQAEILLQIAPNAKESIEEFLNSL